MAYLPPEEVVIAYLAGTCGFQGVSVETPEDLLNKLPFAQVARVGGPSDYINDMATIDVDVINTTRSTALATATAMHLRMMALRGTAVGGCLIDDVDVLMAPRWVNYADEHLQRYVASYTLTTRLGIPLSVAAP